jgi:hypothetical protein
MPLNLPNNNLNIRSNSNLSNLRPQNGLSRLKTPAVSHRGVMENIDINKISKGYLMTEGTYGTNTGVKRFNGLKGQLAKVRHEGRRLSTKNISQKNLEQMHDLIAAPISRSAVSSGTYISRRDRVSIMNKSRQLAKQRDSGFTFEDRRDLMKMVDSMRRQYRDSILKSDDKDSE